jgi:hypothetical protein
MRKLGFAVLLTAIILGAARAEACSVPVFRYALERWLAEPYQVYVFQKGPLGEDPAKIVDWLRKRAEDANVPSNIEVCPVDLDAKCEEQALEIWKRQAGATLPWMVVRYPALYERAGDVWAGPLTAANAAAVVDSPARREIARRILAGDAVVWVLLDSADKTADDAAENVLRTELEKLKKTLTLPEIAPEDVQEGAEAPKIEIALSCLRLSPKDPAERVFIEMLLQSEPDLRSSGKPLAFPVFGQGRLLCALVGAGIKPENLRDIGEFLVGPCSCVVKEQSPGIDLLMSVNWGALSDARFVKPQEPPPLTGIEAFAKPPDNGTIRAFVKPPRDGTKDQSVGYHLAGRINLLPVAAAAAAVLIVLFIVAATVVVRRRGSGSGD